MNRRADRTGQSDTTRCGRMPSLLRVPLTQSGICSNNI